MFKVGDKVVCEDAFEGVGTVIAVGNSSAAYPVTVETSTFWIKSFTFAGVFHLDGSSQLRLESRA